MNSVVVLQARTNSSRLPAKAMLPIRGIPIAVLAAKRAGNTGRHVIVATSDEATDDGLVYILESYGVRYFRGDLEDTLDRTVKSLAEFDDDTVVLRLTADNVFPDGCLLDEIEAEFLSKNHEYLTCNSYYSGLPYGVSVEVTRLSHLREAAEYAKTDYEREHVTPYIINKYGSVVFTKYSNLEMAGYRCTVDCLDDYIGIQSVFLNVHDPVKEPVLKLISSLVGKRYQPCHKEPVKKLVFGTAQLGFNYGIANKTGKPSQLQCMDMLKTAIANGVVYLDTAHAYGESEMALGSSLKDGWLGRVKVITKLSPLDACPSTSEIQTLKAFVDMSIYKSLSALRAQKLDILMLHRASHLYDWNGSAWGRLLEHKENGLICSLGVSVQNPEELLLSLNIPEVEYIQLPFNLIDWRWDEILPQIIREKEKRKLNIHVRSIFLQGLLLTNCEDSWKRANVSDSLNVISWLSDQVNIFHRDNIADLCFAYVNSLHWIDGIVVGMESMDQLKQNIKNLNATPLTMSQVEEINRSRPKLLEISLNPAKWG